jgi:general secretion pathway protein N
VKRGIWITLLAAAAFLAIFIARLPAAWVIPPGAARGACTSLEGSLWSGECAGLTIERRPAGDLSWELHPLQLLLGRLAGHVSLAGPAATLGADVEAGFGGRVTVRHLTGDLPLDPALMPGLPPELHGRAHLDLSLARIEHGAVTELAGRIEARDLEDRSVHATPLGSYVVTFPGGPGEPTGRLRDLEGPLAVEGTLRLKRAGGFELEGLIAARSNAPPELIDNIRFLGSPDASGRRPFSLAGNF